MLKVRVRRTLKEGDQEVPKEVIQQSSFEENPVEFILTKYPTLNQMMTVLMTNSFKEFINGIYVVAPKPTTFKIVLHNNQEFTLTWTGTTYICKIDGKKYYLSFISDRERAIKGIARLLELGTPIGTPGPDSEESSQPQGPSEDAAGTGEEEIPEEEPEEEPITESARRLHTLRETPEDIQQDLITLGVKKDSMKILSKKRVKLIVPRKERDTIVDKIISKLSKKGYKRNKDADKRYHIDTPDGTILVVKPEETQGQASVRIELEALAGISKQLVKIGPADVKVGKNTYASITGARKVKGVPKADLALTNTEGEDVVYISHKHGSSPKDFQQYGGISKFINHPEILSFIKSIKNNKEVKQNGGEMIRGGGFKRAVKDETLILQALYGPDYGGKFGKDNVQIICQGPLQLKKLPGDTYQLTSNHDLLNGTVPREGYAAYFIATFQLDRKDGGIKYCRIGIYPEATRPSAKEI
jgi:hypothetical protein